MEWEKILSESIKDGQIKELHLRKLPVLKTVDDWKRVELLGWIDHQFKYTHYKGGLVKVNDRLFFVQDKTIKALQGFMDWNFPTRIRVFS